MGLFGGIKKRLSDPNFMDRLSAAQATVNGDYGGASAIRGNIAQRQSATAQQQAMADIVQNDARISPEDRAYAMANPGAYVQGRVAAMGKPAGDPYRWRNNNGDLMQVDPNTGQPTVVYDDPTDKLNWITANNPDGTQQIIPVGPNGPIMGGAGGPPAGASRPQAPTAPVGKLTPIEQTMQNTPAPQLNAGGLPDVLSRAQYEAVVNQLGPERASEWVRRFNIQVGNQ